MDFSLPTQTAVAMESFQCPFFSAQYIRLSVCLSAQNVEKPMDLGSPNLTCEWFTMSPGNPFILGSEGQRSGSLVTKTLPTWYCTDVLFFPSSTFQFGVLSMLQSLFSMKLRPPLLLIKLSSKCIYVCVKWYVDHCLPPAATDHATL